MALRVLFRNKQSGERERRTGGGVLRSRSLFLLALVLCSVFSSCSSVPETVQHNDPSLTSEKGKIYYDGNLYSGVVEEKNDQEVLIVKDSISNGEKNGTCYKWWPNGNQRTIAQFANGDYHGEVTNYYEAGQVFSVFHYDHGYEAGLQQMWKADGRIEMNYEVINGRKYGLTGVKNCVNVFEDEGHSF